MNNHRRFYIDGKWVDPVKPALLDVIDPSNEEAYTQISVGSKADVDKAIALAGEMTAPGLKNVWLRPIKNQLAPEFTHILVMEFESEDALKKYADSPSQKKWYETYLKVRDESRTNDVTN